MNLRVFNTRRFHGICGLLILSVLISGVAWKLNLAYASAAGLGISADEALKLLKDGVQRFVDGKRTYPHLDHERLAEVSKGQKPFVTVVSCSDSRVPAEHIFDAGLGDIFSIRIAGNVCDIDEIGSAEYGTEHLGTPLLVVLGHTACGAVTAVANHAEVSENISKLVDNIVPAVEAVKKAHPELKGDALVAEAVKANVWQSIHDLFAGSAIIRELVSEGKLRVIGAIYHIDDGKVEWLGQHPEQKNLLKESASSENKHFLKESGK